MPTPTNATSRLSLSFDGVNATDYDLTTEYFAGEKIELPDQYIRITDLNTGVYKLTYSGIKYLYYSGTTSTSTVAVNGTSATYNSGPVILHVNKSATGNYWQWSYMAGTTSYPIIYYGYSTSTTGSYSSRNLALLPDAGSAGYELIGNGTSSKPVYKQPSGYLSCSTAGATVAKTASCSNFKLATGVTASVKFTYANTAASPTLNINSTGAKSIYYNDKPVSASNTWAAGEIVTFAYSGSSWYAIAYSQKGPIDDGELA